MRAFALGLLASLALLGTTGCSPPIMSPPCLEGSDRRARTVREEWRKADDVHAPWKDRICAAEGLMSFANTLDDDDSPGCIEEVLDDDTAALNEPSPIPYDRLQLARLRAVAATSQTRDHFASKAAAVIEVAAIEERDLAAYRLTPGESGPPLDRAVFRWIALDALANGHLVMNRYDVRETVIARRRRTVDRTERWILQSVVKGQLDAALWGNTPRPIDRETPALFDQVLAETEAALDRPFDRIEHDLLLANLRLLSFHAPRLGRAPAVARLRRRILDHDAKVSAVKGQPAARRDLFVAAALAEVGGEGGGGSVEPLFEAWYEVPAPDLEETLFAPPLYERGFDCRGQDATALFLPKLLAAFDAGTLGAQAHDPKPPAPVTVGIGTLGVFTLDEALKPSPFEKLIGYLPGRPEALDTRPALRALLLAHPEPLLERSRSYWSWDDPLVPLQRVLLVAPPGDEAAIAVVRGLLAAVRQPSPAWRNARDLMLAARVATRLGLDGEIRALADQLAEPPPAPTDPKSPRFGAIAAAGIRASLKASAFAAW